MLSVLAGYPDRVAKRRKPRAPELLLFGGGTAQLSEISVVQDAELMVAVDAEERPGRGVVGPPRQRRRARVAPRPLPGRPGGSGRPPVERRVPARRAHHPARLRRPRARGDSRARASLRGGQRSVLVERPRSPRASSASSTPRPSTQWRTRVALLARGLPRGRLPHCGRGLPARLARALCAGLRSFADLRGRVTARCARTRGYRANRRGCCPPTRPSASPCPAAARVKVHYEPGKPPWVESRLQDFFGMAQGPSVCAGRVPLVLHLLAPNMRAVQVTTDLAGFWERHYPAIRKELCRKYPRHSWPEDPRHAQTPAERGRRTRTGEPGEARLQTSSASPGARCRLP